MFILLLFVGQIGQTIWGNPALIRKIRAWVGVPTHACIFLSRIVSGAITRPIDTGIIPYLLGS